MHVKAVLSKRNDYLYIFSLLAGIPFYKCSHCTKRSWCLEGLQEVINNIIHIHNFPLLESLVWLSNPIPFSEHNMDSHPDRRKHCHTQSHMQCECALFGIQVQVNLGIGSSKASKTGSFLSYLFRFPRQHGQSFSILPAAWANFFTCVCCNVYCCIVWYVSKNCRLDSPKH